MTSVLKHICLFLALGYAIPAQASILPVTDNDGKHDALPYLLILSDSTQGLEVEEVKILDDQDGFKPLSGPQKPLLSGRDYWLKINVQNQTLTNYPNQEWVLHLSLAWTDIEVYAVKSTGQPTLIGRSGFFTPASKRTYKPTLRGNLIKLNLPAGKTQTYYLRVRCDRIHMTPDLLAEVIHADAYENTSRKRTRNNGLFMGFVLMILVYNLSLFSYAKDRAYLYYSSYLLALLVYTGYVSGDLADLLQGWLLDKNPQNISYAKIVVYPGYIAYFAFVRYFLDMDRLLPTWDKIYQIATIVGIPVAAIDIYLITRYQFNFSISDYCTIGYTFLFLLMSFFLVIPVYLSGDKKGRFIVAGVLFMGMGVFMTVMARFQSIEFSSFYFRVGSILEIIVFSLGLAYRQREAERQRQQAAFELEKSKILQQQKDAEAKRLEELSSFKSTLYTNITHEFRTPLTVILGMNEQINGFEKERQLIRRNGKNLLRLINEMLGLAKLEAGKMDFNYKQGDIIVYLQYLAESFYSLAQEKEVRLVFYPEVPSVIMDFDEEKTQKIIYNLLSNALKFTPRGGKVVMHAIKIESDGQPYLQVKIQDTGIGIAAEELEQIFERFYQAESQRGHMAGGTGIGLALTKELTELLGGEITVKSQVNTGSEFTVLLPITQLAEVVSQAPKPFSLPVETPDQGKDRHPKQNLTNDLDLPVLLIIEDNQDVAQYIRTCVGQHYQVLLAFDGAEGIRKAFEYTPDIVISDVMMPEKNGYDVTRTLKQDQRSSHIPIILLTAKATQEERLMGLKEGADAYLVKPFNKSELLIRLEQLIRVRKQMQKKYARQVVQQEPTAEEMENTLEKEFLRQLQEIVEVKINQTDLAVLDLCRAVQLSHSQVYRKLKALTGQTPVQFIRSIRLRKAKELLQSSTLNISEIAYEVGFSDPNYFSRSFQQTFGSPPTAIRNTIENQHSK